MNKLALVISNPNKNFLSTCLQRSNGRRIQLADCTCYAKLLCLQNKKILRCPQRHCHGWKEVEQHTSPDATYKFRIICNVCHAREGIDKWTCFKCNMQQVHCYCNQPVQAKSQSTRKRPAAALSSSVMPTSKRTAT